MCPRASIRASSARERAAGVELRRRQDATVLAPTGVVIPEIPGRPRWVTSVVLRLGRARPLIPHLPADIELRRDGQERT
jgi:hypothetical protein